MTLSGRPRGPSCPCSPRVPYGPSSTAMPYAPVCPDTPAALPSPCAPHSIRSARLLSHPVGPMGSAGPGVLCGSRSYGKPLSPASPSALAAPGSAH